MPDPAEKLAFRCRTLSAAECRARVRPARRGSRAPWPTQCRERGACRRGAPGFPAHLQQNPTRRRKDSAPQPRAGPHAGSAGRCCRTARGVPAVRRIWTRAGKTTPRAAFAIATTRACRLRLARKARNGGAVHRRSRQDARRSPSRFRAPSCRRGTRIRRGNQRGVSGAGGRREGPCWLKNKRCVFSTCIFWPPS